MGVAHFTRAKHFSEKVAFFAQICYHYPSAAENSSFACHQKKVLALVLAFACAFTMFAGAAFTDDADIKTADAVDTLVALGVIDGYADGSFKPEGTVTRAEMAKMIYVIRTGRSDASAYNDDKTTFTDIADHWGRGYIKYCQALGIISGKSTSKFDPNGKVTTAEAAKMLLVTLGYDAQKAGLEGSTWSQKTIALADENGLLEDVVCGTSSPAPRQYAAQLMYNAIFAPTVRLRDGQYTNLNDDGKEYPTVGERYMGLIRTSVIVEGDNTRYTNLNDGQMQVKLNETTSEAGASGDSKVITYKVDNISDMIGQQVELLWKESDDTKGSLDKNDKVYGMYESRGTSVVEATVADIADDFTTANKVKISGKEYEFAAGATLTTNLDAEVTANKSSIEALNTKTGDKIRVLLDDSNKITAVYVTTADLYKVTAVSGDKVSIAGLGTIDTSKNNSTVYDGVAKDDVVAVTKLYKSAVADATFVIEKAESVTGKVTAFSGAKTITMDGTVYKAYGETTLKTGLTDDAVASFTTDDLDDEFTLYLVNNYVRAAQKGSDEMKSYAVVTDVNTGKLDSTFDEPKAELLFADGSKKTVVLHKDSTLNKDNSGHNDGDKVTSADALSAAILPKGEIVKYAEMSNGQYKIKEVVTTTYTTSDSQTPFYNKDTKALKGTVTSGDCVLFYTDNANKYKAVNVRSLDTFNVTSKQTAYVIDDGKVVAAFADLGSKPSGASDDTLYGIITSDGTSTNKDGDPYTMFTIWTGEETTVYVDGDKVSDLSKGKLVSFDKAADDTYTQSNAGTKDFTILDGTANGAKIAVTDYSEADQTITFATALKVEGDAYVADGKTTKAIDDDVKIVYIDADNNAAGDVGMGITEFDGTTGYANALIVYDGGVATNKIVAIIVNTNSDTDVMGNKAVASAQTVTAPGAVTMTNANGLTANVAADKTSVIKGEVITYTVTLSGTTTAATKITFAAGANSAADTANCAVSGSWVAVSATEANIATTTDGAGTVTFKAIANGSGTVGVPTITVDNQ